MQLIWTAYLTTLTFIALVSAIQRELENTDEQSWYWITKQQPLVTGVSLKVNFYRDIPINVGQSLHFQSPPTAIKRLAHCSASVHYQLPRR